MPAVSSRKLIKVLKKKGFVLYRTTGSHRHFKHPSVRKLITVPFHNRDIGRGLMKKILDDAEISIDEFIKLL